MNASHEALSIDIVIEARDDRKFVLWVAFIGAINIEVSGKLGKGQD